jgi:hypothetical protein
MPVPVTDSISRFPIFNPALALITAITREPNDQLPLPNANVQAAFPVTFLAGESVRMIVPDEYGMTQLNNKVVNIIFVDQEIFVIDIDTSTFDAFTVPVAPTQLAQAIPVGENAFMLSGAFRNVLPY